MTDVDNAAEFHKSQIKPAFVFGIIAFFFGWLALFAEVPGWVKVVSWIILVPVVLIMLFMSLISTDAGAGSSEDVSRNEL